MGGLLEFLKFWKSSAEQWRSRTLEGSFPRYVKTKYLNRRVAWQLRFWSWIMGISVWQIVFLRTEWPSDRVVRLS